MSLLRAITTVGGYTLLSRLTGFGRDILIARYVGAGAVSDAFFVAFRFPNLFRSLFAEGAFTAAFVPLYAGVLETEGKEGAALFANRVYSLLALILVVFIAAMEVVMPWAMLLLAPGFQDVPGKMDMVVELSRIAFPFLFFVSLVSLQAGVLNSLGHFAAAAASPILLNLTLIAALVGLTAHVETPGHALAWGVTAAGLLQFLWLAFHCRRAGVHLRLVRPRASERIRLLGKRIVPVVFGSSLYQINLVIGTILASMVSDGAVSYLYYADRVTQLPLGVVGVAVGTALLPVLSRQIKAGNVEGAAHNQNRALEFALLLTVPAAVALAIIATPITATLFQRGAFGPDETVQVARAMVIFALGLPAYVLVKVFAPAFYAREDTATPVRVAALSMATNIALNLALMGPLGHLGIAVGAVASVWINALSLGWVLRRRGHLLLDARTRSRVPRIIAAALGMGAVLWGLVDLLAMPLAGEEAPRALAMGAIILAGLVSYAGLALLSRASSLADFKGFTRRGGA